jgi:hypothetical protein
MTSDYLDISSIEIQNYINTHKKPNLFKYYIRLIKIIYITSLKKL